MIFFINIVKIKQNTFEWSVRARRVYPLYYTLWDAEERISEPSDRQTLSPGPGHGPPRRAWILSPFVTAVYHHCTVFVTTFRGRGGIYSIYIEIRCTLYACVCVCVCVALAAVSVTQWCIIYYYLLLLLLFVNIFMLYRILSLIKYTTVYPRPTNKVVNSREYNKNI